MEIDRQMNLVIELPSAGGSVFVHSMPISREVFRANYLLISRTHAELFGRGMAYAMTGGLKVAAYMLRDVGRMTAAERDQVDARGIQTDGGATALLQEIQRLTNVLVPGPHGYELLPVDIAITQGRLHPEDWDEAEHALVFFTCVSAMAKRSARADIVEKMATVMRALATSLSATEFGASQRTSKPGETTSEAAPPLTADAPAAAPAPHSTHHQRPAALSAPH